MQDADEGEGFDTIFYGDSLVEMWRGTRADKPFGPRAELPGVAWHCPPHLAWRARCMHVRQTCTFPLKCMRLMRHPPSSGIFHDHFQVGGRAAAFGMSGDVVATLHWRLLHGELPRKQHPRHVVVLIGWAMCCAACWL